MPRIIWRNFVVKHWKIFAISTAVFIALVLFALGRLTVEELIRLFTLLFGIV